MGRLPHLLLISFLFCLVGCMPMVPLIQDEPVVQKPLAIIETPEVELRLEQIGRKYDHKIFDLEIINKTGGALEFDPTEILYYASNHRFKTVDDHLYANAASNSIMNPVMLFATDSSDVIRTAITAERNAKIMRGVAMGLVIVAIGAQASNNSKAVRKSDWTFADAKSYQARANAAAATYVAGRVMYSSAMSQGYNAVEDINYLPGELMPSGNVQPFEDRRGKMFFRVASPTGKYWRIIVPVGDYEYVFDFKTQGAKGILQPDTDTPFVKR